MQLICSTPSLQRSLQAVAHLYHEKEPRQVLLSATTAPDGQAGTLGVLGWNARHTLGLWTTLPAQVTHAGQVCVNASHLAGYLTLQPAPTLQLLQEIPETETASSEEMPLQLSCTWTSALGQQVSRHAHFRAQNPGEPPPFLLEQWRERGELIGRQPARVLRAALSTCAPLVAQQKEISDLYGILVHMEQGSMCFTASTRRDLVSQSLPCSDACSLSEPCHVWFTQTDLADLCAMLHDNEDLTLRLVREEGRAVLLIETDMFAACCIGRTTDLPLFLEQAPRFPASGRLNVGCGEFTQAIKRLEQAACISQNHGQVQLSSQGNQLCLELISDSPDGPQMQSIIDITTSTTALPTLLLDLSRTAALVRVLRGSELVLEWGTLAQAVQGQRRLVGFLRLHDETAGTTLVLVRDDIPQESGDYMTSSVHALAALPKEKERAPMNIPSLSEEGAREEERDAPDPSREEEAVVVAVQQRQNTPVISDPILVNEATWISPDASFVLSLRKEPFVLAETLPASLSRTDPADALPQLALYYHRQFLQATRPRAERQACVWIRDQLLRAQSARDAWEQMRAKAQVDEGTLYGQAAHLLQQIGEAGGALEPLIVGVTDGFHHCCLRCGQNAEARANLRFFREQDRRWLLSPEIGPVPRSVYERCQCCLQPLAPTALVVFVPGGTTRHATDCSCGQCDQRGLAWILNLYACDQESQQILLPPLTQIQAPSRSQGIERAVARCWREGWYMLHEDTRVHAHAPLALAPVPDAPLTQPVA